MLSKSEKETLDQIMKQLALREDRQLIQGESAKEYWARQRRHARHAFHANCVARFLAPGLTQALSVTGRTRNLSRGGLGILVSHVCDMGDPVEVQLQLPDCPTIYLAGLVQFIRHAGRGYYELGIALRSTSQQPVFSHDPETALQSVQWLSHLCPTTRLA
jgi:hypothetical protein